LGKRKGALIRKETVLRAADNYSESLLTAVRLQDSVLASHPLHPLRVRRVYCKRVDLADAATAPAQLPATLRHVNEVHPGPARKAFAA
jgi:hypothetical protein